MLEGFGMPFLEARSRGLPVVAEQISAFQELQVQLGAALVDFSDASAVKAAIGRALQSRRTVPNIDHFKWRHIAQDLLKYL